MSDDHQRLWQPLSPLAIAKLFAAAGFPWWIAGGYAIELAAGRSLREHGDVDLLVLRNDHDAVRRFLLNWDCWAVDSPGRLRQWPVGELLPASAHDIWCREYATGPWRLQVMLDETDGPFWRSRRDARISRPIAELGSTNGGQIPYVAPEVQLYYKAKNPRPIDDLDLNAVLPTMSAVQRAWHTMQS